MKNLNSSSSLTSFNGIAAAITALALIMATPAQGSGGGMDDCYDMECNSFFDPEIIQSVQDRPFFRSGHAFYGPASSSVENLDKINLSEWSKYFDQQIVEAPLFALLYKLSVKDLADLIDVIDSSSGKTLSQEAEAIRIALENSGNKPRVIAALQYLKFAKQVEPLAMKAVNEGWGSRTSRPADDFTNIDALIESSRGLIKESDRFLAQRYRYQVLRSLFYSKRYPEAQQYFEAHRNEFTDENSIQYRFLNLGGGAYYKEKKFGKANYLFSRVYDRYPPLKMFAFSSFHPMENDDWQETLSYARNKQETQVLWQMLGIYADGLAALDHIYALDPKSKLLPLLLVREVNKAEEDWTSNRDRVRNGIGNGNGAKPDATVVGPKRLSRIKAIADAGNTYKPYLWTLATGHLLALAGDTVTAEQYIRQAKQSESTAPEIATQVRMSLFFTKLRNIRAIDTKMEPLIAKEMTWLQDKPSEKTFRAGTLHGWARAYLSEIYLKGGDEIRSLMLVDRSTSGLYRDIRRLDAILAFARAPKTDFDRMLIKLYMHSEQELQEFKALNALYTGQIKLAADTIKLAGAGADKVLQADPFTIHIKDCHDCDIAARHTKYTKRSFIERMQALAQAALGRGEGAAQASFELANGYYNMSYYGNGRDIYETAYGNTLSGRSRYVSYIPPAARTGIFQTLMERLDLAPKVAGEAPKDLTTDMALAEKYYLKAAELTSNREFKTKAIFMAAKTEQNHYYNEHPMRDDKSDIHPGKYDKLLKDNYSDTQYYQEILRECGYFRTYATR